jgi:hypothetical protein
MEITLFHAEYEKGSQYNSTTEYECKTVASPLKKEATGERSFYLIQKTPFLLLVGSPSKLNSEKS